MIVGVPMKGQTLGKDIFDGESRTAVFPGDLPDRPVEVLDPKREPGDLKFLRFRSPALQKTAEQFSKATEEMVGFAGKCLDGHCFT